MEDSNAKVEEPRKNDVKVTGDQGDKTVSVAPYPTDKFVEETVKALADELDKVYGKSDSEKRAFAEGFFIYLSEHGILPSEFDTAVAVYEKKAGVIGDVANTVWTIGAPVAASVAAAPAVVGGMAGYELSNAVNAPEDIDYESWKKKELIKAYRRAVEEMRRKNEINAAEIIKT